MLPPIKAAKDKKAMMIYTLSLLKGMEKKSVPYELVKCVSAISNALAPENKGKKTRRRRRSIPVTDVNKVSVAEVIL